MSELFDATRAISEFGTKTRQKKSTLKTNFAAGEISSLDVSRKRTKNAFSDEELMSIEDTACQTFFRLNNGIFGIQIKDQKEYQLNDFLQVFVLLQEAFQSVLVTFKHMYCCQRKDACAIINPTKKAWEHK